jgi:hypothetical protein
LVDELDDKTVVLLDLMLAASLVGWLVLGVVEMMAGWTAP